ncbi:MAG: glutamate cyclase domain-containing protein [Candidatus Thermoplasmatota archaeon]
MKFNDRLTVVSETIDKLITADIGSRGVVDILYRHARKRIRKPLVLHAAEQLKKNVTMGSTVFISTGWLDRPQISMNIAETDGPPGAAVLARALNTGFNAIPIILTESQIVPAMTAITRGVGFVVIPPEQVVHAAKSKAPIRVASVIEFATEARESKKMAQSLLDTFKPSAIICIEKGGMNDKGFIHDSRGFDTTKYLAKIDFLVDAAKDKKILTIGIGDGGNEIGFGLIRDIVKKHIPYGAKCQCPCGSGIAPVTETDALVVSTVSNWGAYGIEACVATILQNQEIMHNSALEHRLLDTSCKVGLIDGIRGCIDSSVDGFPSNVHKSLVEILGAIVKNATKKEVK